MVSIIEECFDNKDIIFFLKNLHFSRFLFAHTWHFVIAIVYQFFELLCEHDSDFGKQKILSYILHSDFARELPSQSVSWVLTLIKLAVYNL